MKKIKKKTKKTMKIKIKLKKKLQFAVYMQFIIINVIHCVYENHFRCNTLMYRISTLRPSLSM